ALAEYWPAVDSAMGWDTAAKRRQGPASLYQEILPQWHKILDTTDRIEALNDQALRNGDLRSAEVFEQFRNRTIGVLGLTLTFGFGAAARSVAHILRLEKDATVRYDEVLR